MQVHTKTLRLIDGQRLEGTPPGVTVLPPPLHPARGREGETFVMLVDLEKGAPSRLYRKIREAAAQAFWTTPNGVTAALRRAVATANNVLFQYNLSEASEGPHYGAISCITLREEELFMAQAGPALACAMEEGYLECFPRESLPPLGMGPYVEVRVSYLLIHEGDRLILASRGLSRTASEDGLRRVLSLEEEEGVLDGLEQIAAGEDLNLLMLHWSTEEAAAEPSPPRRPPQMKLPLPSIRREPPPPEPPPYAPPPPPVKEQKPEEERESVRVWEPVEEIEEEEEEPILRVSRPEPAPEPSSSRLSLSSLVQRLRRSDRLRQVSAGLRGGAARAGGWLSGVATRVGEGARTLLRRALPDQEAPAQIRKSKARAEPPPERTHLMAGIAILILVIVMIVTVWAWLTHGNQARQEQVLSQARQQAQLARQSTDPSEQREHWQAVLTTLAGFEEIPEGMQLLEEAQEALDQMDGVIRVQPTVLWAPATDVSVDSLVVQGSTIFLRDVEQQSVIELTLLEGGGGVADQSPAILTMGEQRNEGQVAAIVDLAWNHPGGEWTLDRLVVLDANNQLWVYDPAWPDNTYPISLEASQEDSIPIGMGTFEGRLYLLDSGADQIWRYWPHGGEYPDPPEPYFPTDIPQSLSFPLDLAIDGNIYVLRADGGVVKYFDSEPAPFEVRGVPQPPPRFAALAVDPNQTDGPIYLADIADERLVILDHTGTFQAQLRTDEPGLFRGMKAIALDDIASRLFILAEGGLCVIPLPPLP